MKCSRWRRSPRVQYATFLALLCLGSTVEAAVPSDGVVTARSPLAGRGAPVDSADCLAPATLEKIRAGNQAGRFSETERAARACLRDAERDCGEESAEVAELLDELALALRRGGKSAEPEALEVCERALRIKARIFGTGDTRYATGLYNLGLIHLRRMDLQRALSALEQSLDIRTRALGSNHADVAKSLLALGAVQHDLGNYAEGLALTERAVAIEEVALGAKNPERAYGVDALAGARYGTGDYSGAIPLLEEAISLWESSPNLNRGAHAACLHNLGTTYKVLGDYGRAIKTLQRALRIYESNDGADDPIAATTLSVLGTARQETGDLSGAQDCYRRAIRILETKAPGNPEVGWHRSKLGWAYLEDGSLSKAGDAFRKALEEQKRVLGSNHPNLWIALLGLATEARSRGQRDMAREYYDQTIKLVRDTSGPRHPDLGRTLAEYASFLLDTGDSLAALNTALQASEINREHLRLTARGTTERLGLLYTSSLKTGLGVALAALRSQRGPGADESIRRVWDAVIRSRALVLDEVAERARIVGGAGELLEWAKRLEDARGRLANLLVRASSHDAPVRERQSLDRAREDVERAERELALRSAPFRMGQDQAALGWDQIASALAPGSGLVAYIDHGESDTRSYSAFVLGPDRTPRVVGLGSADEIDRLIAKWRTLVGTPPRGGPRDAAAAETACRNAGKALRVRIWDPVESLIAGSREVFVVPYGPVHLVNVVALPAPGAGYLVESPQVVHYLSTERALVTAERQIPRGVGLLALGGASFDLREVPPSADSIPMVMAAGPPAPPTSGAVYREAVQACESFRSVRFETLPGTVTEVDEIRRLWGRPEEVLVLKGRSAGERSLKALLPGRRVAHLATHGFFLEGSCRESHAGTAASRRGIGGISITTAPHAPPRVPAGHNLLAGLALAGANRRGLAGSEEEDGILTAEEIASLNLSGLDWVVLSACDTGVGKVESGEGVLGLRRAFEIAGARTLIMSLWAVEDRSARDWMCLLYEGRFQRNLGTAEAIREATLGALRLRRTQGLSTHPFYWAAFVAAGGWR